MRKKITTKSPVVSAACGLLICLPAAAVRAEDTNAAPAAPAAPAPSTNAAPAAMPAPSNPMYPGIDLKPIPFDTSLFLSDPTYADKPYDPEAQLDIYGNKHAVVSTRPLLELGRELFTSGAFEPAPAYLGEKNLIFQHLYVYGDWRTAVGWDDTGVPAGAVAPGTIGPRGAILSTRVDLDVDYQFTATERIHAFFRPFEHAGQLTRFDFGNTDTRPANAVGEKSAHFRIDGTPLALFLEGDAARIWSGISDKDNNADIPFAAGLMPLVIQNGIWLESAFTGVAVTIPARHSALLGIANMDVTFFAGLANVNSGAVNLPQNFPANTNGPAGLQQGTYGAPNAQIFGVASFIEANQGYWEADYGYTQVQGDFQHQGLSYNNMSVAFTRRYFDLVSDSVRVIENFSQSQNKTADGTLFLCENSFVTPLEVTLVPYANFFLGINSPQSLARDPGAGGVLVNTGINFETDGLTGLPTLDATGHDTYGGAIGCEYLFNLDQQLVLECATVQILNDNAHEGRTAAGPQYALGLRYQIPLTRSWILRADAMTAIRQNAPDLDGVRFELRYKF